MLNDLFDNLISSVAKSRAGLPSGSSKSRTTSMISNSTIDSKTDNNQRKISEQVQPTLKQHTTSGSVDIQSLDSLSSGLPTVHIKSTQQQHKFLSRKSKKQMKRADSCPEIESKGSPNLIGVPIEELITQGFRQTSVNDNNQANMLTISENGMEGILVDTGVDCLSGHCQDVESIDTVPCGNLIEYENDESFVTVDNIQPEGPTTFSENTRPSTYERQFSDALIIPSPFDQPESPLSPEMQIRSSNIV